ncbi:MAG: ADP-ribosylglycohydrolase family protein [Spirochaeta sp.]|jgi:ADP-ribosyl-[dinitrogen reductase] hydrolase|nr:ADP-ribosylglycohydrolase family protein [Spirochaeta sp.]
MNSSRWSAELALAVECAVTAGKRFREEFCRSDGPRGARGAAVIDDEVELDVRSQLTGAFPAYGYLGEETGSAPSTGSTFAIGSDGVTQPVWVVDPNDGTSAFQAGYRGASVSIALIDRGRPVLGVVYAYNAPTDDGDLIAWAEGAPLRRWAPERLDTPVFQERRDPAQPVTPPSETFDRRAGDYRPILVSHKADTRPVANALLGGERRFRAVVGIAYRLALTAVGEGAAAVTLTAPRSWDMAGGHALLRGAGMELYTAEEGIVSYDEQGYCSRSDAYFGGSAETVQALTAADWRRAFGEGTPERQRNTIPHAVAPLELAGRTLPAPVGPHAATSQPRGGGAPQGDDGAHTARRCVSAAVLDRAQGVLLGQCAGDSLGSLVEFLSPEAIAERYPSTSGSPGPHHLADGGTFGTIAGQPTDDTEMALLLARSLVSAGTYDRESVGAAYRWWLDSEPFDAGMTISAALSGRMNPESQANGALMRVSPLGVFGAGMRLADADIEANTATATDIDAVSRLARAARRDAELTHVHPNCAAVNVLFAYAIAEAVANPGSTPRDIYHGVLHRAAGEDIPAEVRGWTSAAGSEFPENYLTKQGWVRIAWQNALRQLLTANDPATAIRETVRRGGDTDTNAAICGALVGAVHGASGFPAMWRTIISSARPIEGMFGVFRPRPQVLWPVDWEALAEQLLLTGLHTQ